MFKYLSLFLLAVLLLFSFDVAFADMTDDTWRDGCLNMMDSFGRFGMMDGYGMMNFGRIGGGWGIFSMFLAVIFQIIIWAIIIVAVFALVRWIYARIFKGELWVFGKKETAEDVLKMRYAKGEITKEEYESARQELAK